MPRAPFCVDPLGSRRPDAVQSRDKIEGSIRGLALHVECHCGRSHQLSTPDIQHDPDGELRFGVGRSIARARPGALARRGLRADGKEPYTVLVLSSFRSFPHDSVRLNWPRLAASRDRKPPMSNEDVSCTRVWNIPRWQEHCHRMISGTTSSPK